eukprot:CAMPEP_0115167746 /NCGR_PEP_ID=MMETSP0270-20121206/386_1 /TAXON_ID=71861 /ORGANISM="Scrippsiella trochoidea, Strain CCMP3099" /LENGTH=409 /DNA_ID=CAMNT_0002580371 /DNA_START=382 /DNA_END=1609 /DNA_ORIENTATION=-
MASRRIGYHLRRPAWTALLIGLVFVSPRWHRRPASLALSAHGEHLSIAPKSLDAKALCGTRVAGRYGSHKLIAHIPAEKSSLSSEGGAGPAPGAVLNKATAPLFLMVLAMLCGGNMPLLKSLQSTGLSPAAALILRFAAHPAARVELALFLSFAFSLQIMALGKIAASSCSVFLACTGVVVQVLELVFDGKVVSPPVGLASIGTLLGIVLFNAGPGPVATGPAELAGGVPGEVLALLSTTCLALHMWRSSKKQPADEEDSEGFALALASFQCPLVLLFCVLLHAMMGTVSTQSMLAAASAMTPGSWAQAAACGLLCTGLPMLLEISAFQLVPASLTSLIYATTPVWGLMFAMLFLGEPCRLTSCGAGLLILACAAAPSLWQTRRGGGSAGTTSEHCGISTTTVPSVAVA